MNSVYDLIDTPLGVLRIVAGHDALAGVYFAEHRRAPAIRGERRKDHPVLVAAARQLAEYFAGAREVFDLPLHAEGTDFEQRVWRALAAIPFGATFTYRQLAEAIGKPGAARAAGGANARNPLSIVVPCHRVIGSDGSLTGYAGGEEAKRRLLAHEARVLGRLTHDNVRAAM